MKTELFDFLLFALAIWRITHLLSNEDGPFDLVFKLRKKLGQGFFGNLLDCFYCLSIWISFPFACYLGKTWGEIFIYCFAFSGLVCIIQKLIESKK